MLKRPRKATSLMGGTQEKEQLAVWDPSLGHYPPGGWKPRCRWLALGAGGLESGCCSCCSFFPLGSSMGTCCTEQCSSLCPSLSASFTPSVSKCATVGSYSISNLRTVAFYRASTQPCEAKALNVSHIRSLPQTSECGLKPVLGLESLILFSCPHGRGCRTGFQCSSECCDPEQLLGLNPQVAVLAALGKLQ